MVGHLLSMATKRGGGPTSRRDTNTNRVFGEVLREFRRGAGETQESMGNTVGIDRAYVSELERGLKEPCLSTLLKLGRCLGVSSGDILREVERRLGT
jgi:transcriptional regulator with XRE-family HTH domain